MACTTCTSNFLIPGIAKIYYAPVDELDYYISGDTVVLNELLPFSRLNIADGLSSFSQKLVSDSRGQYYQHSFDVSHSAFNNQEAIDLSSQSLVFIFKDTNNQWFIAGYDQPLSQDKLEGSNGGKNESNVSFSSDSYMKVRSIRKECWFDSECDCDLEISSIVTTNESFEGAKDGTITITMVGDTSNLYYSIGGDYQTSNVFASLGEGHYSVSILNKCIVGCFVSQTAIVGQSNIKHYDVEGGLTALNAVWRVQFYTTIDSAVDDLVNTDSYTDILTGTGNTVTGLAIDLSGATYSNSGIVRFYKNGVLQSAIPFTGGTTIGYISFMFSGLMSGDDLEIEVVDLPFTTTTTTTSTSTTSTSTTTSTTSTSTTTTTAAPTTCAIVASNSSDPLNGNRIESISVNGFPITVTSGSYPVNSSDMLFGTTDQMGTQMVIVNINTTNAGACLALSDGTTSYYQNIDSPGNYVFGGVSVAVGISIAIYNGVCF